MKKLTKQDCLVGVMGEQDIDDTKMTNSQTGYMYEFGEPALNIPSSNFLSIGMENGIRHGMDTLIRDLQSVLSLQDDPRSHITVALEDMGKSCVKEVKKVCPEVLQDHIEYKVD